jgi:type I restriction enzyme S subunit
MSDWKEYKLGEIVDVNRQSIGKDYAFNEIEYLDTGSITENKIEGFQYFNINDAPSRAKRLVQENDIIYSTVRPIQRHYGFMEKFNPNLVVSTGFAVITTKKGKADPKYLYYLLSSTDVVNFLDSIADGSTSAYPSLRPDDIAQLEFTLPSLPEQIAIAEILSSLDDKIDLLHRQNKTLEQLAETLFRQWFVEEADVGWEETRLGYHTNVFRGLSYKGKGLTNAGNGLPMHNLNSVHEFGGYKYEGIKYYNGKYKERHLIKPGEIIITNTEQGHEHRLIGFPGIVPLIYGELGLFSQHIYKIIPLETTYLTNEFIYYLLMNPSVREQIIGATNGSTVNMLAIDGLQRPEFKLPPKDIVQKFSEITQEYWKKKNENHKQIYTLSNFRDTLLPKLMNGDISVKIN